MPNQVSKESTTALIAESFIANKTTTQLLEKLADKNIDQLNIANAQETVLKSLYTKNQPELKKELTTKIASILTTGSLSLFGKPVLSPDLAKVVESAQKKMVTSEEAKDNKMIEAQAPRGPKGPGQGS